MRIPGRLLSCALILALASAGSAARNAEEAAPDINSLVARLSGDYCYDRESALAALIERAADAMPAMLSALQSDNYHTRAAAVRFFEAAATTESCPQLLDALKNSKENEVVTGLTRLLARLKFKDAVEHFRELLSNDASGVRAAAVDALAALEDRESANRIAALLGDEYSEVRIAAAQALAAFHAEEFGRDVFEAFKKESVPKAQRSLVDCLGELRARDAAPLLVEAIKEESPVFYQAVKALAKIGGDEARDALIDLLMRSDDLDLLDLSSSAVGQIGESALLILEEKLKGMSEDLNGRWKILNAYGKMGRYTVPCIMGFLEREPYPFFKDRASLMLLELVGREYGVPLPPGDYRLFYDEEYGEWKRKIENWKNWWEEHKDDGQPSPRE